MVNTESIIMRKNNNIFGNCGYLLVLVLCYEFLSGGQLNRTSGLYDLDGDGYPAPRKAKNPRDGFTEVSVCKIAMTLNQTATNAQILVMPEMKCDRPDARMSLFLSSDTIGGALSEFVKTLKSRGFLVVDKTRAGVRRILLGPARR